MSARGGGSAARRPARRSASVGVAARLAGVGLAALLAGSATGCGGSTGAGGGLRPGGPVAASGAPASGAPRAAPAAATAETGRSRPAATAPGAEPVPLAEVTVELARVAALRGLGVRSEIRSVRLGHDALLARVREQLDRDVPEELLRAQEDLLVALGVAPADFDYRASLLQLLGAELAGFYDPHTDTMVLGAELAGEAATATLAHELVHALQDQHFDLGARLDPRPGDSDRQAALHSLAEGDATSAMLDRLLAAEGSTALDLPDALIGVQIRGAAALAGGAPGVPGLLVRSLVAPYLDGLALVHALRRRGGWAEVDRVWREPPATTEQLLHPERLLRREPALVVPTPAGPAPGWELALVDTLGEQGLRLLLEEWTPRLVASAAAEGWGGDRFALHRRGDELGLALHLRFDDAPAARRARSAFAASLGDPRGALCVERPGLGPLLVGGAARDVVVVAGPFARRGGQVTALSDCAAAQRWAARIGARGR